MVILTCRMDDLVCSHDFLRGVESQGIKNGATHGCFTDSPQRRNQSGGWLDYLTYTYENYNGTSYNNRLSRVSGMGPITGLGSTSVDFKYDLNGNVTDLFNTGNPYFSFQQWKYDARNLATQSRHGYTTSYYRYNGDGQRIYKKVGSGDAEHYVMNGTELVAVLSQSGSSFTLDYWRSSYGRQEGDDAYFYLTDHLGSTRAVLRDNNTVGEAYDFYPFGAAMPGRNWGSQDTKERFTGKEHDETGMDYFGARYYAAGIGRWMGVDPKDDQYPGWSPYNYAIGNPVSVIDPNGEEIQVCQTNQTTDDDGNEVEEELCVTYKAGMDPDDYERYSFIFAAIGNLNKLQTSSNGSFVLNALKDSETLYSVSNDIPARGFATWSVDELSIRAGRLLDVDGQTGVELLAHEAFHAFQYEVAGITGKSVNSEVGSFVFQMIIRDDLFWGAGPPLGGIYGTTDGQAYDDATYELIKTGIPFNSEAYESAIRNFKSGSHSNIQQTYTDYPVLPISLDPPLKRLYSR